MRELVVRQVNPIAIVVAVLGAAATAGLVLLWSQLGPGDDGLSPVALLIIAVLAWGAYQRAARASVRLRIDADAIVMPTGASHVRGGLTAVPWETAEEIVLTLAGEAGTPMTLAVRLRPGAPLPRSVKGRISDPDDPEADDEQLTAKIGDLGIDLGRLREALRSFAGDVPVRERHIETFRIGGAS